MLNSFFAIIVIYISCGKFRILSKIRINELSQKESGGRNKLSRVLETNKEFHFYSKMASLWSILIRGQITLVAILRADCSEARKEAWGPVRRREQKSRQEKMMMVWIMMIAVHICCQILDIFFKVAFMILFWSTWTLRVRRLIKGNCKDFFLFWL